MTALLLDDIEQLIAEYGQMLTNEELDDLTRSSTKDEDDESREADANEERTT